MGYHEVINNVMKRSVIWRSRKLIV